MPTQRSLSVFMAMSGLFVLSAPASADTAYGLTAGNTTTLVSFDTSDPQSLATIGAVSGIADGMSLRAIDFRPADGLLYGVATQGVLGQLYKIDIANAVASSVGRGFLFDSDPGLSVSMDFNPVVDRIRVVSGSGLNYRLVPTTGVVAAVDTALTPGTVLGDVAYANNVVGASQTTLYGYDYATGQLVTIGGVNGVPSPNLGVITSVGSTGLLSTGARFVGFDISQATGTAYLSLDHLLGSSADSEFYTVNLSTGAATLAGAIPVSLLDFSLALPVPEPTGIALMLAGLGVLGFAMRRRLLPGV